SPRGLAFNGNQLYVAEAGSGGTLLGGVGGSGNEFFYGTTGRISTRSIGGTQSVYLEGLPSVAGATGTDAEGPSDIAFGPDGLLYATVGLGADPALRQSAPLNTQALAGWLGSVIRQNADYSVQRVIDVGGYELAEN